MPKLLDREPTQEMLKAIASSDCAPSNYKRMFQSAYDAAPEVEQEHFDMFEVFVQHDRIYFAIGNQSFQLAFVPEDEPDRSAGQVAEWYMDQLRHALSSLQSSDAQAEIAKRDARIKKLEAAVAFNDQTSRHYLEGRTEALHEISRLKALVGECEKKLRSIKTDVDSAPHIPISMTLNEIAFSVEEAIAAIKEEGL